MWPHGDCNEWAGLARTAPHRARGDNGGGRVGHRLHHTEAEAEEAEERESTPRERWMCGRRRGSCARRPRRSRGGWCASSVRGAYVRRPGAHRAAVSPPPGRRHRARAQMLHVFAALGYSALQQPAAPPPLLRPGESRVVGGCLVEHRGDLLRLCSSIEPENIQAGSRPHAYSHTHTSRTRLLAQASAHARSHACSRSGTWRAAARPTTPA